MGVWIETLLPVGITFKMKSHPAWVCGLKLYWPDREGILNCHTLRGCVDWNILASMSESMSHCHTLRGCVDWNFKFRFWHPCYRCHTLRGCVDWNIHLENFSMAVIVTPCVGVWIETLSKQPRQLLYPVTPCVGVWIETTGRSPYVATDGGSHPAWVCGLKRMCKLHQ